MASETLGYPVMLNSHELRRLFDELEQLRQEKSKWKSLLAKYGAHKEACKCWLVRRPEIKDCDCGFIAALGIKQN